MLDGDTLYSLLHPEYPEQCDWHVTLFRKYLLNKRRNDFENKNEYMLKNIYMFFFKIKS